jgi:uncharacterized membrane protein
MTVRNLYDRTVQTILCQAGGIIMVTPVYAAISGGGAAQSTLVITLVFAAAIVWAALFNTLFDLLEWHLAYRVASDRPHFWRVLHAVILEGSTLVVSVPIFVWIGGHSVGEAMMIDLGLTAFCAVYAYFFFLGYDRLRPLRRDHDHGQTRSMPEQALGRAGQSGSTSPPARSA